MPTSATGCAAPHHTNAAARPSPSAVKRLPVSNSLMSRRSRRRLWTQESSRPGSSDGRSTANFSDSGLASAAGSTPAAQNGRAAARSMNAKVIDSEKPAAWSTRRTPRSRRDAFVGRRLRRRERRKRGRQPIEAVVAADLLDQIDLARDIDPERRHGDAQRAALEIGPLDAEAERRQDPRDVVLRHVHPEHVRDARGPQGDDLGLAQRRVAIDQAPIGRPAPVCLKSAAARAIPIGGASMSAPRS